jgi:hypothetical protein
MIALTLRNGQLWGESDFPPLRMIAAALQCQKTRNTTSMCLPSDKNPSHLSKNTISGLLMQYAG